MNKILTTLFLIFALCASTMAFCSSEADDFLTERLVLLKNKGFQPAVIYDIGAHKGFWTLEVQKTFDKAKFILFEANANNKPFLEKLPFPHFCTLLGDRNDMATFYSIDGTGDSMFREQTHFYEEGSCHERQIPMSTLAAVVNDHKLPLPDFIKLDVQGAEKLIIQGSPSIISHAEVVILESKILEYNKGAPSLFEIMTLMDGLGYCLLDIVEMHYLPTQELNEVDLLFVKKNSSLIKKGILW